MELPKHLIRSINRGECIAFVGAGFSAEAVPSWADLLRRISEAASLQLEAEVGVALSRPAPTAFELEACAQRLKKKLGPDGFENALSQQLASPRLNPTMDERLRCLRGIPFRAILTTNFDGLLDGEVPGRDAYLRVLRSTDYEWWRERYWNEDRSDTTGARVVKLHGDIAAKPPRKLVLTRMAYRERLYGNPAYQTFLRAVLATSTVLYLGFSFTDAYLNELRSEVLALLEHREADEPVAYAILNDMTPAEVAYFRECEGIGVLPFDSKGGQDFSGFDRYLGDLHDATNPTQRLGSLLAGKRLIWLDARPENNDFGMKFLQAAAGTQGCVVESVTHWRDAIAHLKARPADLLITHWGHNRELQPTGGPCAVAERVLVEIRRRKLRVPVVIFASRDFARANRRTALGLGCQAYAHDWGRLFQEIERLFSEEDEDD